jgi:hypothetical protein
VKKLVLGAQEQPPALVYQYRLDQYQLDELEAEDWNQELEEVNRMSGLYPDP